MHHLKSLFLLDPEVIFLNHGSFGACPRPVFEVYQSFQRELERQPVAFLGRRFPQMMYEARTALAEFLGTRAENLVYVPNATTAGNIVARSISLSERDEVLATDLEYGAMDRMWSRITGEAGAIYRRVPVPLPVIGEADFVERIWSAVSDRTRVLFLSHITSSTGLVLPIKELIRRARETGILTFIDGAHVPGQLELRLDDLGVDFYTGNCHKWLFAPKGAAFLWVRPESQSLIEPLVVSWGNQSIEDSAFIQENEFQGTRDIAPYLSVPAGIQFYRDHDWDRVASRCRALTQEVRSMFVEVLGGEALAPPSWYAQMAAHEVASDDPAGLKDRLYDEFSIEIPISRLGDRWFIRASVQGYNGEDDFERLGAALAALGARAPVETAA
jgi:isopenicillin-N epimerase